MAYKTINVAFVIGDEAMNDIYESLFDGKMPDDVNEAMADVLHAMLFDDDGLDVAIDGTFTITDVTDLAPPDETSAKTDDDDAGETSAA